ncbi:MAG: class I SAM-dependent methyltransferase [Roseovarius sp.]|nr:class I SAM-dependent methyltransferase [Roseovarius sp.]
MTQAPNADQAEYWSSPAGQTWATHQVQMDTLLAGVLDVVVAQGAPAAGEHVVDIGCGTGASSLLLARRVGQNGRVTALDIGEPLLTMAQDRAQAAALDNLEFVLGDAQTYEFPPQAADLVISRFGVMFFSDPVAAMANLRRATRKGGRLAMICWQGAPENPWFMLPMKAAMARLGRPDPMDPIAPGPMAFKDITRITGILRDAGWAQAKGENVEVDLIPPQTLEAATEMAITIGPATRLIGEKNASDADIAEIKAACKAAFAQYQTEAGLRIPGRVIVYTARNNR